MLLSTLPVSPSFDGPTGAPAEENADEEAMEEEQVCTAAVSGHVCVGFARADYQMNHQADSNPSIPV